MDHIDQAHIKFPNILYKLKLKFGRWSLTEHAVVST